MDGPAEPPIDYQEAKRLAADGAVADRRALAGGASSRPEILYYLAEDGEPIVRVAVARNPETPVQADKLLAGDDYDAVRCELAVKLGERVAALDAEPSEKRRAIIIGILERLAGDEVIRVRQVLAEALKEIAAAPDEVIAHVIRPLSQDREIDVAGPLLEFSPLLGAADLLEVLADVAPDGALVSIARRMGLDGDVADAVVGKALRPDQNDGEAAIGALLANPSAQIREDTLDRILDTAPDRESWHRPLARRPSLPVRAARRLVEFLTETLLDELRNRKDLDPATTKAVAAAVRDRLAAEEPVAEEPEVSAADQAKALQAAGELDEDAVSDALFEGKKELAAAALALLAELPGAVVDKIVESRSPKAVTALAWKAGVSMRVAIQIQTRLASIAPNAVLNARKGTNYPLSEDDMTWQIEFFGG